MIDSSLICCVKQVRIIWWYDWVRSPSIHLLSLFYTWLLVKWRLLLIQILLLPDWLLCDLRRKLVLLLLWVLGLLHESKWLCVLFAIELLFVVLQKSVILNNFIFYMWQASHNTYLALVIGRFCLIGLDVLFFHCIYEFVTNSHNISREVSPFNLGFIQSFFRELFFFLQSNQRFLHLNKSIISFFVTGLIQIIYSAVLLML